MGAYTCYLAGIGHRPRSAHKLLTAARKPCLLAARREPDNPHDSNAISLWLSGEMVGYLPARQASWVAERIDGGNFAEIYLMKADGLASAHEPEAQLLVVTTIFDAPDGTASAIEADKMALEQIAMAEARKQDESIAAVMTEAAAVLLWIAASGDTSEDLRDAVIDDFMMGELAIRGWSTTRDRVARLRQGAKQFKGSKQRALRALDILAQDPPLLARLVPYLMKMAKADGSLAEGEAAALREMIARVGKG
jgi:uncharacterized tellurite resistance protein B-like protein